MQPRNTFAGCLTIVTLFCAIHAPVVAQEANPDVIKVISLQHANAVEMLSIVDQIFGDELSKAADQRTNAMVVRGPKPTVEMMLMVLEELDRVVEQPPVEAQLRNARNVNSGPATLRPSKGTFQVRSPRQGTILSIRVKDRESVKKGDVLAMLDVHADGDTKQLSKTMAKAEAKERAELLSKQQRQLAVRMVDAEHRLSLAQRQIAQSVATSKLQKLALETKLADAQGKFKVLSTRAAIAEDRSQSGTAPPEEALVLKAESESAKRAIELLKQQLELHSSGEQLEIGKIEHEAAMARMTAKEIKEDLQRIAKQARADEAANRVREQVSQDRRGRVPEHPSMAILAPRDGVVQLLKVKPGSMVRSGQPIFVIDEKRADP